MDKVSILPTRQVQIMQEDILRLESASWSFAIARVTVAIGPPIFVPVSGFTIWFLGAHRRRAASQNDRIFFPIANAVVLMACILFARIVIEHRQTFQATAIAQSIMRSGELCGNSHSG